MYSIDTQALKAKIVYRGFNQGKFANLLGISQNTLSQYLKTPEKMQYNIILKMIELLDLSREEIEAIFFSEKLAKNESL